MSAKNKPNKPQCIVINPFAKKEKKNFLRRCDKLYFSMLQNNNCIKTDKK